MCSAMSFSDQDTFIVLHGEIKERLFLLVVFYHY